MIMVSTALGEILHASTLHSFVMATSIVPMAVTKNLAVGVRMVILNFFNTIGSLHASKE